MGPLTASPERCFGQPGTVEDLSRCLREAGERLQKLKAEVVQEIHERVPGSWDGEAAETFNELMDRQMDAVVELADGACFASQGLKTLEVGLAAAKAKFEMAQMEAVAWDLRITGDLHVVPWKPDPDPPTLAAVTRVQAEVDEAKATADRAREEATRHLERLDDVCWSIYNSIFPQPPMQAPGARIRNPRPPRGPRRPGPGHNLPWGPPPQWGEIKPIAAYKKGLRQLAVRDAQGRDVLVTWTNDGRVHMQLFDTNAAGQRVIVKEEWIGTISPMPPGTPGTTAYGLQMEPLVLDKIEQVTGWDLKRFGPGYTGPDIVPK